VELVTAWLEDLITVVTSEKEAATPPEESISDAAPTTSVTADTTAATAVTVDPIAATTNVAIVNADITETESGDWEREEQREVESGSLVSGSTAKAYWFSS